MRLRGRIRESVSSQRGFALIALLALAALISAFLIASTLNFTSAGNSQEREDRSMSALRQAKAALIAYAANEQWQAYKLQQTDQPGALPCPDINHNGTESDEGNSDCVGLGISNTTNLIGRIPWKALGIDDLRDASGERLWYALSFNFRKLSGTTVINSDTQACDTPACNAGESQLTVTGTAPASNVVAIVFAPGQALDLRQIGGPLQIRPADHTNPAYKDPINYLENFSLGDVTGRHYTFSTNAIPVDTFNDRLVVITQAELMAAVEPVVAARIERDIKPLLQDYFNKWGAYPFPVPFGGGGPPAAQSAYQGVSNLHPRGLLPLTNAGNLTWASAAVTQLVGHPMQTGTSPTVTSSSCSISSSPSQATCQVNYCCASDERPVIKLEVFLANATTTFVDTPSVNDAAALTMTANPGGVVVNGGGVYGFWSFVPPFFPPTLSFVAQATGGAVTYVGRLQPPAAAPNGTNGGVLITVPLPAPASISYLPVISDNPGPGGVNPNPNGAWFIANQWYKQTYYAVSPGYVPGGVPVGSTATCSPLPVTPPTPPCLKVSNLPSPFDNKGVILVLAGRVLNGSSRPSGIANYLEGANLTAANDTTPFVYEHRAGTATTINDRVVVVSP